MNHLFFQALIAKLLALLGFFCLALAGCNRDKVIFENHGYALLRISEDRHVIVESTESRLEVVPGNITGWNSNKKCIYGYIKPMPYFEDGNVMVDKSNLGYFIFWYSSRKLEKNMKKEQWEEALRTASVLDFSLRKTW
jgi:hypothetical protein